MSDPKKCVKEIIVSACNECPYMHGNRYHLPVCLAVKNKDGENKTFSFIDDPTKIPEWCGLENRRAGICVDETVKTICEAIEYYDCGAPQCRSKAIEILNALINKIKGALDER